MRNHLQASVGMNLGMAPLPAAPSGISAWISKFFRRGLPDRHQAIASLRAPVQEMAPVLGQSLIATLIPPSTNSPTGLWAVLYPAGIAGDFTLTSIAPSTDKKMAMDPDLRIAGIYTDGLNNPLYATSSPHVKAKDIASIPLLGNFTTPAGRFTTIIVENRNRRELPFFVLVNGRSQGQPLATVAAEVVDSQTALDRSNGYVGRPSR